MRLFDTIILGGGATGLTVAAKLAGSGRLCVVDEYDRLGGNHISREIDGCSFDIGAFVFQEDDPLFHAFPAMGPALLGQDLSLGRITPAGRLSHYPYSVKNDLVAGGVIEILRAGTSLLWGKLRYRRPRNAAEFAKFFMGGRVYRTSGLEHYIARLFGVRPDTVELEFARKRMNWIARAGSLSGWSRRRAINRPLPPRPAIRPKAGFIAFYEPARAQLEAQGVQLMLGQAPTRVEKQGQDFVITVGSEVLQCRRLISTIPLTTLAELAGVSGGASLRSLDLASLYFSFEGDRGFSQTVLYNFSQSGLWKRLTMHSDGYGRVDGREYFSVEAPMQAKDVDTYDALEADFRASVAAAGLLLGDLRLLGADRTKFAYPIYTEGASATAAALIATLEGLGIEFVGRQGRFDYLPTAKEGAKKAFEHLGIPGGEARLPVGP